MKKLRRTYRQGSPVASLNQGGTGKTSEIPALNALHALGKGKLGAMNGIMSRNAFGRVNSNVVRECLANQINVAGSEEIHLNKPTFLYITNFDILSIYSAESDDVNVLYDPTSRRVYQPDYNTGNPIEDISIDDNQVQRVSLTLTNPNFINPIRVKLIRNNIPRILELTGIKPGVISPEFIGWENGQLVSRQRLTIQLNVFKTYPVDQDLHTATDWGVYLDKECTKPMMSLVNDRADKYTKVLPGTLPANTDIWVRVRFKGAANGYSPYRVIQLRTAND